MKEAYLEKYWSKIMPPLTLGQVEGLAKPMHDYRYALDPDHPAELLELQPCLLEYGLAETESGQIMLANAVEFPGATPRMFEWWFGYMEYESERYQTWHPLDHISARREPDMRDHPDPKYRYVGTTGIIDEYIGPGQVQHIAITFDEPSVVGFDQDDIDQRGLWVLTAHAIDRDTGASLCDRQVYVAYPLPGGVLLKLRFWFAPGTPETAARKLLQHSSNEYGHLAEFLPHLYAEVTGDTVKRQRGEAH
jgi:hypothetical protein